mgnify:CR=1 FL=1
MVRVGVIGAGKWGKNHINAYASLASTGICELVGLADINASAEEIAKEHGILFFRDYRELLKSVDAVSVVVPTDSHYDVVKECLAAGKHVLVEKPITTEAKKSKELVEFAEKKGLLLSVGYLYRYNSAVQELKRIMEEIGKIQYITARYIHSTKPPRKDSGAILNLSIHLIDTLNFIMKDRPDRIFCKKSNLLSEEFEDSATILLDYGRFFANIEVSCCHPEKKRDLWIIASKEKVYVDLLEQSVVRYPLHVGYDMVERKGQREAQLDKKEPLKEELAYFCNAVREKNRSEFKDIINIGREEYYTTRICELCVISAETGKEQTIKFDIESGKELESQ